MEPISFGLGIVAEARTVLSSIENRIASYRDGPAKFRTLSIHLNCLAKQIAQVEMVLSKFPTVIPKEISVIFDGTFSRVQGILEDSNATMESSFSMAFATRVNGMQNKIKSKAVRTFRANALRRKMEDLEANIKHASDQLLQLSLSLGNALKIHEALIPKLEYLADREASADTFYTRTNAPALNDTINLDFDLQDGEGGPLNPEGILKQSVLLDDEPSTATAGPGVMKRAYGIVGMAGVGKTVAMQGLAHDKDIQTRFPDGVLYMALGQGATEHTVLRELTKVLVITGARKIAIFVKQCTVLRDAVDHATPWFQGKSFLLLVDDIWPTVECKTGFFKDLRQLLRDSPASCMVISTRSTMVAQYAGVMLQFRVRDPLGKASRDIFMSHATSGLSQKPNVELAARLGSNALKILSICAGLPIALSVTGTAVAFLSRIYGDFESACQSYAARLEKKRTLLGDEDTLEGTSLNAGILLSLEFLESELLKLKANRLEDTKYSVSDLYASQAWASVSVLGRLWRLDEDDAMDVVNLFCGMSLATLRVLSASSASSIGTGIVLHDLQIDFCQRQAIRAKMSNHWHAELLNGYLETRFIPVAETDSKSIASFMPRPWWSKEVPEDGYIHANLSRHLSLSGNGIELAALLLDWRWTEFRGRNGGILALKKDFAILDHFFLLWERSRGQEALEGVARRGFRQIFKAVQLSWGRVTKGPRVFQFQVCGYLTRLRKSNIIVHAFLKSVYKYCSKPFLLPMNSFFPESNSAIMMEIPVGEACLCVVSSPCERFIAAGSGSNIVLAKSGSGEILQHLRGHKECVTCIAFALGSKKIVSGSRDKTIVIWDWESSGSPARILEGHDSFVWGVAISRDGGQIFSCSRDKTLRAWDAIRGTQTCVLSQGEGITCVALCGEARKIAIGLRRGTFKVLDTISKEVVFENAEAHNLDVSSVSFSPDGSFLATGSLDKTICLWNTETWTKPSVCLKGHKKCVKCVVFSADGKRIASSSWDGTIRLWDAKSGNCIGISPKIDSPMEGVSFIFGGTRIVSGSYDGIVRIWDAEFETYPKDRICGHSDHVLGVAISENGLQVASASKDRTVLLWDAHTGEQIGLAMEGHTDWVFCVSFSPDGRRVVSSSRDGTLRLWDTETQTQIGDPFQGNKNVEWCVSFSRDGCRIISGSLDMTVKIWDAAAHKQVGEALQGHHHWVFNVSESTDGYYIVSRDIHARTIIWNRINRAILWTSGNITGGEKNGEKNGTTDQGTFGKEISEDEVERVIRSCGQLSPLLWPKTFPQYRAKLYCDKKLVYSSFPETETVLADLDVEDCKYLAKRNLFAAGLQSGAVAICRLANE